MNLIRTAVINIETNVHNLITWFFNIIHTTIDCFDGIIEQWTVENIEKEDNNRGKKIGF